MQIERASGRSEAVWGVCYPAGANMLVCQDRKSGTPPQRPAAGLGRTSDCMEEKAMVISLKDRGVRPRDGESAKMRAQSIPWERRAA